MKITDQHTNSHYTEVSQKSPIRWRLLYQDSPDSFVTQSSWFKCKDYMNDVVVALQAKKYFSVYGFSNKDVKSNDTGIFVEIKDFGSLFEENLGTINKIIADKWNFPPVTIEYTVDKNLVLLFPSFYWTNTLYVSLIFSLIRCAAYNIKISSFDDMTNVETTLKKAYLDSLEELLRSYKKEELDKFIVVTGHKISLERDDIYSIHNAGWMTWTLCYLHRGGKL